MIRRPKRNNKSQKHWQKNLKKKNDFLEVAAVLLLPGSGFD